MEKTCGYLGYFIFLLCFSFSVFFFFGWEKEKIDFVREGAVEDYLSVSLPVSLSHSFRSIYCLKNENCCF
jgi:hypothetical protein